MTKKVSEMNYSEVVELIAKTAAQSNELGLAMKEYNHLEVNGNRIINCSLTKIMYYVGMELTNIEMAETIGVLTLGGRQAIKALGYKDAGEMLEAKEGMLTLMKLKADKIAVEEQIKELDLIVDMFPKEDKDAYKLKTLSDRFDNK